MHRVGMCQHWKSAKGAARRTIRVQVTLHQQPGLPGQGQPDRGLVIRIHRLGDGSLLLGAHRIGELLGTDHQGHIHQFGSHRHKAHLKGGGTGGAGSFDGEGFDAFQAGIIRQQRGQVALVRGDR